SRAGKRLMGFCRTNLFKRLESGGPAFIQSLERHVLRNFVVLHAIDHGLEVPLGAQGAELLDARTFDEDADASIPGLPLDDENARGDDAEDDEEVGAADVPTPTPDEASYQRRAADVYALYASQYRRRFKWLRRDFFVDALKQDLLADSRALIDVLRACGRWEPDKDAKLAALVALLTERHPTEKVLVFTQFADTVRYLVPQLAARGLTSIEGVTGQSADPTELAWRFSPVSNGKRASIPPHQELRVLVATDVLSEGQNLQDCAIIVNYDLPWAIIRLVQRAGRVDRIGQQAQEIACYSFLPADGVERIINLRGRVRRRLRENAEVVGTDEAFFEDDRDDRPIIDLYNEKAGILDGDADSEVDLASFAYQIWKNAVDRDPSIQKTVAALPDVVYSTRAHTAGPGQPPGVLVYLRTAEGTDALAWIDEAGQSVTQSQLTILQAAASTPATPAQRRHERHHELVQGGVEHIVEEEKLVGGQLGRPSGARFRTYERLKRYAETMKGTLFDHPE
ncbi:MAG: C-terminal helicase domain-containing protein, partial [Chloroflexota bacterium]